jgi:hypothetical protein
MFKSILFYSMVELIVLTGLFSSLPLPILATFQHLKSFHVPFYSFLLVLSTDMHFHSQLDYYCSPLCIVFIYRLCLVVDVTTLLYFEVVDP